MLLYYGIEYTVYFDNPARVISIIVSVRYVISFFITVTPFIYNTLFNVKTFQKIKFGNMYIKPQAKLFSMP